MELSPPTIFITNWFKQKKHFAKKKTSAQKHNKTTAKIHGPGAIAWKQKMLSQDCLINLARTLRDAQPLQLRNARNHKQMQNLYQILERMHKPPTARQPPATSHAPATATTCTKSKQSTQTNISRSKLQIHKNAHSRIASTRWPWLHACGVGTKTADDSKATIACKHWGNIKTAMQTMIGMLKLNEATPRWVTKQRFTNFKLLNKKLWTR